MILKDSEIKYVVLMTIFSHLKFWILIYPQNLAKKKCKFSQIHLLRNNFATKVVQNFFANSLSIFLHPKFFSSPSYLHEKKYNRLKTWQRLRGGMMVIFKMNLENFFTVVECYYSLPQKRFFYSCDQIIHLVIFH